MASHEDNLTRIEIIAEGLKELADESIFIGGACIQFYMSNPGLWSYRPTKDIDCIVKIYTYSEFAAYSDSLRKLGFKNDTSENAPIVRWVYKDILVDTIPDESSIVGYKDIKWFKEGREHAVKRVLPSGKIIKILPLPYFLATKLESWNDRGGNDFTASPDLEDIVCIVEGNDNLDEILTAPASVNNYVIQSFADLLQMEEFRRSIAGHIGFEESASERAKDVIDKITGFVDSGETG